jgi:hypothetical protein
MNITSYVLQIELLISMGFTISRMFGIGRTTLYRRMEEWGIRSLQFSCLSDHNLDKAIKEIKLLHPHSGISMLQGHLRSRNIIVPRHRVRSSLHRTDSVNTALRWGMVSYRRTYSVPGPNALWHIGNK